MGLSDFSGGVQEALAQLIKDRLEAEEVQRRAKQQEFQNQRALNTEGFREREFGEGTRRFDLGHEIDTGNLGLRRDEFGLQKREYEEGAPMREATLDHTQAQTGDILRRPQAEAEDRTHDVSMENLRGTWGLRTIGAQGSEQRRTQSHGASLQPKGGGVGGVSPYSGERARRVVQSVDELIGEKQPDGSYKGGMINGWTAGAGSLLAGLPSTDARLVAGKLKTLGSGIAFNELTEMREASKTGGALGAIAVKELELLESSLGSIDQGLDGADLINELAKVRESMTRWHETKSRMAGATSAQIDTGNMGANNPNANLGGGNRVDELLRKYGGG